MRPEWLQKIFDEEREEGREEGIKDFAKKLLEKGLLTKEQIDEFSSKYMLTN